MIPNRAAEIFGAELAVGDTQTFSGAKAAVFTWFGCTLTLTGDVEVEYASICHFKWVEVQASGLVPIPPVTHFVVSARSDTPPATRRWVPISTFMPPLRTEGLGSRLACWPNE